MSGRGRRPDPDPELDRREGERASGGAGGWLGFREGVGIRWDGVGLLVAWMASWAVRPRERGLCLFCLFSVLSFYNCFIFSLILSTFYSNIKVVPKSVLLIIPLILKFKPLDKIL